jgi:hypothetical protein
MSTTTAATATKTAEERLNELLHICRMPGDKVGKLQTLLFGSRWKYVISDLAGCISSHKEDVLEKRIRHIINPHSSTRDCNDDDSERELQLEKDGMIEGYLRDTKYIKLEELREISQNLFNNACFNGNLKIAKFLVEAEIFIPIFGTYSNYNVTNSFDYPFELACREGQLHIVKWFFKYKNEIFKDSTFELRHEQTLKSVRAFYLAMEHRRWNVIRYIMYNSEDSRNINILYIPAFRDMKLTTEDRLVFHRKVTDEIRAGLDFKSTPLISPELDGVEYGFLIPTCTFIVPSTGVTTTILINPTTPTRNCTCPHCAICPLADLRTFPTITEIQHLEPTSTPAPTAT